MPMLVADVAEAHVPGKQSVHDDACSSDQVPALQLRHVVIEVAATTEDHVPATQFEHIETDVAVAVLE